MLFDELLVSFQYALQSPSDLCKSVCYFVTVCSGVSWVTWRPDDELVLLTGLRSGLDVVDFITGLVFKNTATAAHSCLFLAFGTTFKCLYAHVRQCKGLFTSSTWSFSFRAILYLTNALGNNYSLYLLYFSKNIKSNWLTVCQIDKYNITLHYLILDLKKETQKNWQSTLKNEIVDRQKKFPEFSLIIHFFQNLSLSFPEKL